MENTLRYIIIILSLLTACDSFSKLEVIEDICARAIECGYIYPHDYPYCVDYIDERANDATIRAWEPCLGEFFCDDFNQCLLEA